MYVYIPAFSKHYHNALISMYNCTYISGMVLSNLNLQTNIASRPTGIYRQSYISANADAIDDVD